MNKVFSVDFLKVFGAWKEMEKCDRSVLKRELDELRWSADEAFSSLISYGEENYRMFCFSFDFNISKNIPNLIKFFADVKEVSNEWYQNITEGNDIINIDDFLKLKDKESEETIDVFIKFIDFTRYISHAILKIYDENEYEKKISMLKGLLLI